MELHVVPNYSCPLVVLVKVQKVSCIVSCTVTNEESSMCITIRCGKSLKDSKIGGKGDEKGMEG